MIIAFNSDTKMNFFSGEQIHVNYHKSKKGKGVI